MFFKKNVKKYFLLPFDVYFGRQLLTTARFALCTVQGVGGGKQNRLVVKSIPSDRSSLSLLNSRATNSTNQNKMEEK